MLRVLRDYRGITSEKAMCIAYETYALNDKIIEPKDRIQYLMNTSDCLLENLKSDEKNDNKIKVLERSEIYLNFAITCVDRLEEKELKARALEDAAIRKIDIAQAAKDSFKELPEEISKFIDRLSRSSNDLFVQAFEVANSEEKPALKNSLKYQFALSGIQAAPRLRGISSDNFNKIYKSSVTKLEDAINELKLDPSINESYDKRYSKLIFIGRSLNEIFKYLVQAEDKYSVAGLLHSTYQAALATAKASRIKYSKFSLLRTKTNPISNTGAMTIASSASAIYEVRPDLAKNLYITAYEIAGIEAKNIYSRNNSFKVTELISSKAALCQDITDGYKLFSFGIEIADTNSNETERDFEKSNIFRNALEYLYETQYNSISQANLAKNSPEQIDSGKLIVGIITEAIKNDALSFDTYKLHSLVNLVKDRYLLAIIKDGIEQIKINHLEQKIRRSPIEEIAHKVVSNSRV